MVLEWLLAGHGWQDPSPDSGLKVPWPQAENGGRERKKRKRRGESEWVIKNMPDAGTVAHACGPSDSGGQTGGLQVQGQLQELRETPSQNRK